MNVIWNITKQCDYKCSFCASGGDNIYETTTLNCTQLKKLIKSMATLHADDIDLSGGEPLLHPNVFKIIDLLNYNYKKKIVSLTSTGRYTKRISDNFFKSNICCYDFTYDYPYDLQSSHRDSAYNIHNLKEAYRLKGLGLNVKAQIPLFKDNIDMSIMSILLNQLKEKKIKNVQFLRLMPLGRQKLNKYPFDILNKSKIREIYEYSLYIDMEPDLHCSLKGVLNKNKVICNMIKEKIGVDQFGNVFSCPWAEHLNIIENPFKIGNLLESDLEEIVAKSNNSYKYKENSCNLFNFILANNDSPLKNDPLYSQ